MLKAAEAFADAKGLSIFKKKDQYAEYMAYPLQVQLAAFVKCVTEIRRCD